MEKHIFKYLDKKYIVDTSKVGNYGIYTPNDINDPFRIPYNGSRLLKEIAIVFAIGDEISKNHVNNWANRKDNLCNLEFYWEHNSNGDWFPIAGRVSSTLLGQDLLEVQPMSAPRNDICYLDYNYVCGVDVANDTDTMVISRFPVNYDASSKHFIEPQTVVNKKWSDCLEGLICVNPLLNKRHSFSLKELTDDKEESLSDDEDIYL